MSEYDWNDEKAEANLRRRGITFAEAATVASNPLAVLEPDSDHSDLEERVKVVGWSPKGRLLVVIVSSPGHNPRIISARRATKRERHAYETRP